MTQKKEVALKSTIESLEDDSNYSLSDDKIIFFAMRLKRLMRNKGKSKCSSSKEHKRYLSKIIYHHCKKADHFKYDCPKFKKEDKIRKDKKKVLTASCEDLENNSEEKESEHEDHVCLMVDDNKAEKIYLASKKKKDMWYLDSECSRHMIGKTTFFIKLNKYEGGFVTFSDDGKEKIKP
ncbi:uncharacterized protein LOC107646466 [Arachis ipaensis]|uniref:uncharacterized protein LOC107646466 n=1 Tax=Arachis ipaensis TaxID=130454 RepID=UPI0007AFBC66|nr:uncharacterized protein LOC107646466 [Arachis ipaensis]XP_025661187.1 uncharacterized protein LOC112756782 [Arachis hypogaea]